eukprot:CAMPEP_0182454208 /NCGR_PEP_ID=MMETSP1319-20130603/946_1 /TAXON_ID=172717 /ORGANISM="Bolidomonas pacifica, Strain RCC208" /LENGTH=180 /DNA_ID=CAMNT_0024652203 /DNA_START=518 /DNA_END=1058 /DNA_ORIENTATION=+
MTLRNTPPSPPTGPLLTAPTNDNGGADADADADEADADTFFHLTSAPPLSAHSNDTDLTNRPFSPLHVAPGISLYDRIPPAAALGGDKEGIWAERYSAVEGFVNGDSGNPYPNLSQNVQARAAYGETVSSQPTTYFAPLNPIPTPNTPLPLNPTSTPTTTRTPTPNTPTTRRTITPPHRP